jgi:nucleoside 2-deoxyribosyltransferase
MIYLASPFSHSEPAVRHARYVAVCKAAAFLIANGCHVFSPIAHSYALAEVGGLDGDWETWRALDLSMIARCDELMVVTLDGWDKSVGVAAEVAEAERLGKPVFHLAWEA